MEDRSRSVSAGQGSFATRAILFVGWLGACAVAVGLYVLGHRRWGWAGLMIGLGALAMGIARTRVVRERSSVPRLG